MTVGTLLVTGAAGKVARSVIPRLATSCDTLRLTDRVPIELDGAIASASATVADLRDPDAVRTLVDGVDAIVHFAGHPREADWSVLVDANLRTVTTLWEAAAAAGVGRIVYASSNHAVGYYARDRRIDARVPVRPDGRYGVTKAFMEAVAQMHADKHGLRALGIRIGFCGPAPLEARMLSHWIHPDDLAQLIGLGLTADLHHEVVYGVSDNRASWYDNRIAHALGYRPLHSADRFADALSGRTTGDPVAERYQGGLFAADGHVGDPERPARAA